MNDRQKYRVRRIGNLGDVDAETIKASGFEYIFACLAGVYGCMCIDQ